MTENDNFGVLYVATGQRYVALAQQSINFLKRIEPNLPVAVATTKEGRSSLNGATESIIQIDEPNFSYDDKILALRETPYEKTIYLDCDTLPIRPFSRDVFWALEQFDVLALGNMSFNLEWESVLFSPVLTQLNTGVLAFRRKHIIEITRHWSRLRNENSESHDQPTFRLALLQSGARLAQFPPDFNFMGSARVVEGVRIVHFAGERGEVFSARNVKRATKKLMGAEPGSFWVDWRCVMSNRFHFWNIVRVSITLAVRQARSGVAKRGLTRRRLLTIVRRKRPIRRR